MEATKKCPHCGGEVNSEAAKCKHCKEWINEPIATKNEYKLCPNCGGEIALEAKKCKHCSEWLPIPEQPTSVVEAECTEEQSPEAEKYKHSDVTAISSFLMFVIACDWFQNLISIVDVGRAHGRGVIGLALYAAQICPEWIISTLMTLSYIYIYYALRQHFAAHRGIISSNIIISLGAFLLIFASVASGSADMFDIAMLLLVVSMVALFIIEIIIGSKISRNYAGAKTLGVTLIVTTIISAICDLPDMMGEPELVFYTISSVASLAFCVVINNYFNSRTTYAIANNDKTKREVEKVTSESKSNAFRNWIIIASAIIAICTALVGDGDGFDNMSRGGGDIEDIYILSELTPNVDYSRYVALASDDEEDTEPHNSAYYGDLQIVCTNYSMSDEFDIVLRSSEIEATIYEIFASTVYPDIFYFNAVDYEYLNKCGKVNIKTGTYNILNGTILGMLEEGTYRNCYFLWRNGDICIYEQAGIDVLNGAVMQFDKEEYLGDLDLHDDSNVLDVIDWLENQ